MKKTIKVKEKRLGRERVWGLAYKNKNLIEIEKKLKGKRRLCVLCHELFHKAFPKESETNIRKAETLVGNTLWAQNYRRVDN